MHEVSLVRSIFSTLEQSFESEELSRLNRIDLRVGLLSNVEPVLMQNAFEAVTTAEKKYQNVSLNIELVPIEVLCPDCKQTSRVEHYKFVCDHCGKPTNDVVKGLELLIHQVGFDDPPDG